MSVFSRALSVLLLCLLPMLAQAEVAIPQLRQRVTDLTQTLTAEQNAALEQRLAGLEQRSGAQVAILMLPTTQPEDIFSYGMRVVESWKLGAKGKDNGVLVLLAKNDRKSQILVGYGLEGDIPDVRAKRIVDDIARPWFRQGDFNGGLNAVVSELAFSIEGKVMETGQQQKPPPAQPVRAPLDPRQAKLLLIALGLFALGQVLRLSFGPMKAAAVTGGIGIPAVALVLGSLATGLIWGAGLFVLVLIFRFSWLLLFLQASGGFGHGHSGGGGGFGGGGGGFGGGGSSGSW